jgi:Protein of unknown function (DUF3617)
MEDGKMRATHRDGAAGSIPYSPFAIRHSRAPRAALAALAVILAAPVSTAFADGIEAGLWKVTTTSVTGGNAGPPRQSSKCLTAEQVKDLAATFSPIASTINSTCEPIERSFDGKKLAWHLVCKGQLDMQLDGEFDFDSLHHYTGTVVSAASMAGQPMPGSKNTVEGEWVSACPQ